VRSRNLENEEAKAVYWAVKIQPQWVVTPGKQTTTTTTTTTTHIHCIQSEVGWLMSDEL
jgi:hypothetical protein